MESKTESENKKNVEDFFKKAMEVAKGFVPEDNNKIIEQIKELENILFDVLKDIHINRSNPDYDIKSSMEFYKMTENRLKDLKRDREEYSELSHNLISGISDAVYLQNTKY